MLPRLSFALLLVVWMGYVHSYSFPRHSYRQAAFSASQSLPTFIDHRTSSAWQLSATSSQKKKSSGKSLSSDTLVGFSRIVNVANVPKRRGVFCRLLASERERAAIADRLDMSSLSYFAANVTVSFQSPQIILVTGSVEVRIDPIDIEDDEEEISTIQSKFETKLLVNVEGADPISEEEDDDIDDEVGASGDIDVGDIAVQFFGMELSW